MYCLLRLYHFKVEYGPPKDGLHREGELVDTSTLKKLYSLSTSDHPSLDMQKMLWPEAPYLLLCPCSSNQTVPLLPPEA